MNLYARLPEVRQEASANSVAANDPQWLRALAGASDEVAAKCGRQFEARIGTWTIDVPQPNRANEFGRRLWLPFDVVSITSLKLWTAAPLTFGTTLVENTDFVAYHEDGDSAKPIVYLDVLGGSSVLGRWTPGGQQLQLTCVRGYSYDTETTTLTGTVGNGTATTVTASADASAIIYAGDTIRIEDEQMYVSAVSTVSLTVERGVNGTTAAQHSGKAISFRRYPRAIEEATKLRAIDFFLAKRSAASGQGEDAGFSTPGLYRQFMGLIGAYRRWGVN